MNKLINVYVRKGDGIYVIPHGITTQGFCVETEPFEFLSLSSSVEEIWTAIEKALLNANKKIPHPESWSEEKAWYRKAGVKTWRQFGSKAEAISLEETEVEYVFNKLEWQRGSFVGHREAKFGVRKNAPHEDIVATFTRCLPGVKQ